MLAHFFPKQLEELEPFQGQFDARRLQSDKVDVYFASYPAGTAIEEHTHDTDNVGVITSGSLTLIMNGKEQRFTTGEWYEVPANTPHAARFDEDTAEIELWFKK